jgi:hypothetical protein
LVYFPPFWYFVPRKIWQPWLTIVVQPCPTVVIFSGITFALFSSSPNHSKLIKV